MVTLIRRGLGTKEIAQQLGISQNAVKAHVTKLLRKFGVANRAALVAVLSHYVLEGALEERQRFHDLLQAAPVGILLTRGAEHVVEYANGASLRGQRVEEVVGLPLAATPYYSASAATRDEVLRTGVRRTIHEHRRLRTTVGGEADVYLTVAYEPVRDERGAVDGVMSIAVDESEMVRQQQLVHRLTDEQRAILDLLPSGVAIFDRERVVLVNRAALRLFGADEEFRGSLADAFARTDAIDPETGRTPRLEETPIGRALLGESTTRLYLRRATGAGEMWLRAKGAPVRDEAGNVAGAVVVFDELTEVEAYRRAV